MSSELASTEQVAGVIKLLRRLWQHLGTRRHRQLGLLLLLTIISAILEIVSLGAVLPFISVLISPERAFQLPIVKFAAPFWGVTSPAQLSLALTVVFITVSLVAGAIRLFVLWLNTRLSFQIGKDLSLSSYRRTLYQPYWVHVSRNSSAVISGNVNKTGIVASSVILPALTFISQTFLLVAIVCVLVAVDPVIALSSAAGLGMCYLLISRMSHRRLQRNSQRNADAQTAVLKTLQEGLGGIRNILLDGTQAYYCKLFKKADSTLREAQGDTAFISVSPRFVMEALGMAILAFIAYTVSARRGAVGDTLPVLGVLALGAQRLLPAMQQCFTSWSSIVGHQASLADTLVLLDQPLPPEASAPPPAPLKFESAIRFENVRFRYHVDAPWVLDGVTFSIQKGARVGIVGSTGSGKSTVLDLLMGLLEPTEGSILVDGEVITRNRIREWQGNIAHVPQNVYLADATVAENIAFGVPSESIDMQRVVQVAHQAHIAEFIEKKPEAYGAMAGERGVRLSGGQRQRIGIARALYRSGSVLVFDEATSALDNVTEQAVMEAIESLSSDLTIILIAHRLSTVRRCDLIVELDHGKVAATGTYDDLVQESKSFQAMATTGHG